MSDSPVPALPQPDSNPQPALPVRVEFIPTDVEMIPAALPATTGFEQWLMRNIRPLLLICLSLTLEGFVLLAHAGLSGQRPAQVERTAPTIDRAEALEKIQKSPVTAVQVAIVGVGFLASLALGIAYIASTEEKRWVRSLLLDFPARHQPALRALDLVAMVCVFSAAASAMGTAVLYFSGGALDPSLRMVVTLGIMACAASITIAAGVHLARARGGGPHGSLGVWPFWTRSKLETRGSILSDIGMGIGAYVLTAWMLVVLIHLNNAIVEALGRTPDQHDLVQIIAQKQNPWVLLAIGLSATLGAAFFEELFFRGMLYNVLRRYIGGVYSALLAGFIFSIAHGIESQILGLWFLGMVMTWLYDRTGRLVASMTFHFTNNFVALMSMIISQQMG
ncbi:MAG TPA: CPBP family intramembrane glutamic endopeptidase [Planctomycetota bacterium]|nr:CPBP family intramembrane glutamic endopeptidase [Planctomycetota bacterium]